MVKKCDVFPSFYFLIVLSIRFYPYKNGVIVSKDEEEFVVFFSFVVDIRQKVCNESYITFPTMCFVLSEPRAISFHVQSFLSIDIPWLLFVFVRHTSYIFI